ncbi:hypothetical protein PY479_11665 [Shewanella sp. A32]|uniref:hypothetical protein n=1 Tax=Shewanella sp. A32 TaxID=3031327 RepID=UPI0023BA1F7D|nr:hypothetical protein [Shewanella sp. A32]MDF0534929.1 hypothetical protein [Shewanella sp. A32]
MANQNRKKDHKRSFAILDSYRNILNNNLKPDENIFYARECLLPMLDVKMLVKERSREELSDVDLILFKLIKQGINSVASVALLTGLAEKQVQKKFHEMIGRSFISVENELVALTELGEETLREGVPIKQVQRSYRYCAVSERLLPRSAYDLPFIPLDDLRNDDVKPIHFQHVLTEKKLVNLAGLDFSTIEDKRAYNITDEAISFEEVKGYISGYLQAKLFIIGDHQPTSALVSFGSQYLEYDLPQILEMMVPLNSNLMQTKLKEAHQQFLLEFDNIEWDALGLPVLYVDKAPLEWLSKSLESGIPAILLCGTDQYHPKPVSLPKLQGYTCRYYLTSSSQQQDADQLQAFAQDCDGYFKVPFPQRPFKSVQEFIGAKYREDELSRLWKLTEEYQIKRLRHCLPPLAEGVE